MPQIFLYKYYFTLLRLASKWTKKLEIFGDTKGTLN